MHEDRVRSAGYITLQGYALQRKWLERLTGGSCIGACEVQYKPEWNSSFDVSGFSSLSLSAILDGDGCFGSGV